MPITSFTRARSPKVYNADIDELQGGHEDVTGVPHLWIRLGASTEEKREVRAAHVAAALANVPKYEDPYRVRIPTQREIPMERLAVASDAFWRGPDFIPRGARRDIDDEIVRAARGMFRRADGSPLLPKAS